MNNLVIKYKRMALLLSLIIAVLTGVFYWFEIRPAKIRRGCLWVKKHTDAKPAIPPTSDNEILVEGKIVDCTSIVKGDSSSLYNKLIHSDLVIKSCEEREKGIPAIDAKDWEEPASKEEYDFCIRENGLFR